MYISNHIFIIKIGIENGIPLPNDSGGNEIGILEIVDRTGIQSLSNRIESFKRYLLFGRNQWIFRMEKEKGAVDTTRYNLDTIKTKITNPIHSKFWEESHS